MRELRARVAATDFVRAGSMRWCCAGAVLVAMVGMASAQVPNAGVNAVANPMDINSLLKAEINGEDTPGDMDLGALQGEESRQRSVQSAVANHSPVMDISGVALDPLSTTGFSADPEDYTVDGEVVCQTVKEALLALKTVSADQLKTAATYEADQAASEAAPAGRKLLGRGASLQDKVPVNMDVHMIQLPNGQTVPAACPGEIAGLNFGSCLNYFFTVNCVHDHQGLIDDLIGSGPGMRPKTLDDYRQVVISIFKSVPPCKTTDEGATVTREHTCQDSVERLGAMQYPQLIRNAIAKVEAQLSPTNTEVMRTVSATMKQFANLASPQAVVMVASPLDNGASTPSEGEQGEESAEKETQQPVKYSSPLAKSMPIFVCILALALGAIALAVYYLRKEELFDRMDQISRVTQGYAKMMTESVEASSAAFSTSSTSTLSSRADRGTTGKRAASTVKNVTVDGAEDAIPALQAKLNLLREATASAYDNAL